jgi:hypothetical protein
LHLPFDHALLVSMGSHFGFCNYFRKDNGRIRTIDLLLLAGPSDLGNFSTFSGKAARCTKFYSYCP